MKKKFIIFIQAALLLILLAYGASASGWELTATPQESASASVNGDSFTLSFSGAASLRSAAAEQSFDFAKNSQISIGFTASFKGTQPEINRRVFIRNSSTKSTELVNFTGTSLEVLGSEVAAALKENTDYRIAMAIDPTLKTLAVWLDNSCVFSGEIGTKWKVTDLSAAKIFIRNNTTSKTETITSELRLTNFTIGDKPSAVTFAPADGAEFVDVGTLTAIEVGFDMPPSPETMQRSNIILTKNSEAVGFTVEPINGRGMRIVPEDGFEPLCEYAVTVKSVYDLFGTSVKDNISAGFTTAGEGYVPPAVAISAARYEIYDTETEQISISAQSESGISKIELYMNGTRIAEQSGDRLDYTLSADAGEYSFYAVAYDSNGGSGKSGEIKINVLHNAVPAVTIELEKGSYTPNKLTTVKVSAADSDGSVEKIELYAGSRLVKTITGADGTVDLSGLPLGRTLIIAKAYDNLGAVGEANVSIVIAGEAKENTAFSSDFEAYTSTGGDAPSGMFAVLNGDCKISSANGYGDEYGTVVELSSEGKEVDGASANGTWLRFNTTGTRSGYSIEFDIYLCDSNANPAFMLKHPSQSIAIQQVEFNKDGKGLFLHNNSGSNVSRDIELMRWYHVRYDVDMLAHTYSFWLDGEQLAENFGTLPTLTQIDTRFVLNMLNTALPAKVAFDNLTIKLREPSVQITGIGYDDKADCETVSPEAKTLVFTVNTSLSAATVSKSTALLYCGEEQMLYDMVAYNTTDKTVTVTLSEPLRSDRDYTFKLTESVMTDASAPLTGGAAAYFSTGFKAFDVYSAEVKTTSDGAYGTGKLINSGKKPQSCIVILNVFDGSRLAAVKAMEITVEAGKTKPFTTETAEYKPGYTVEMYVWSDISTMDVITQDAYTN